MEKAVQGESPLSALQKAAVDAVFARLEPTLKEVAAREVDLMRALEKVGQEVEEVSRMLDSILGQPGEAEHEGTASQNPAT
jgi:hypothetical protein